MASEPDSGWIWAQLSPIFKRRATPGHINPDQKALDDAVLKKMEQYLTSYEQFAPIFDALKELEREMAQSENSN